MKRLIEQAEAELSRLPSVAFKVVQLALLDVLTFGLVVVLCFLPGHVSDIAVPIYSGWLTFLAALHGVTLVAFHMATQSATTTASGQELTSPGATPGGTDDPVGPPPPRPLPQPAPEVELG